MTTAGQPNPSNDAGFQGLLLPRAHRDCAAARRFFERTINLHGLPEKITIDESGANTAAIEGIRADSGAEIEMCQSK